jgi:hypothetical protein
MKHTTNRAAALIAAITIGLITACADVTKSPTIPGSRAAKDSTEIEGDTTECRSGWIVSQGRYVCSGSGG